MAVMESIKIEKGKSLEEYADIDSTDASLLVEIGKRKALLRSVENDQAELIVKVQGGSPALGYLKLEGYVVQSESINIPDNSYIYDKNHEFNTLLRRARI